MIERGEIIDNRTLCRLFAVANSGGMRRSLAGNHIVVVSDWTKRGVKNRWDGDVLHYTGQGQGDQQMVRQNLNLARSADTGEAVHLFEVHEPGRYVYRGRAELAGEPYRERQRDSDGRERAVIIFPLRVVPIAEQTRPSPIEGLPVPKAAPPVYLPAGIYAVVRDGIDPAKMAEVHGLLDRLKAIGGTDVVDRRDVAEDEYNRALNRCYQDTEANLRLAARQVVRDRQARYRSEGRQWAFAPDEIEIDAFAGEERVREVLDMIGSGDLFNKLRQEAYDRTPQPEPPPTLAPEPEILTEEDMAEIREISRRRMRF